MGRKHKFRPDLTGARFNFLRNNPSAFGIEITDLDKNSAAYCAKNGLNLLDFGSEHYPPLLREIYDPPLVLTISGDVKHLSDPCVAIVGARKASSHGRKMAYDIAKKLAQAGFTVASGLAYGIDSSAHLGALDGGGATIAVLGCGIDMAYPAKNHELKKKIKNNGAIVSEFPLGTNPLPSNFPQRNRIISGLSIAVIVIEAALKSGSLITAVHALEQGRDVMALRSVGGEIYAQGSDQLIEDGALEIKNADEVVSKLMSGF